MKKLTLMLVLALSLVGGGHASADSSWFDAGDCEQNTTLPDIGVTWE